VVFYRLAIRRSKNPAPRHRSVITFLFCLIGWFSTAAVLAHRDGQMKFAIGNALLAIVAAFVLYLHWRPA
jgi:uncharacterized membrane protein YsdA (DUF1294 family)